MGKSKKELDKVKKIGTSGIVYSLLFIWAAIQIFPIYWLFTFSLKSNSEIFGGNALGLPKEWMWQITRKHL